MIIKERKLRSNNENKNYVVVILLSCPHPISNVSAMIKKKKFTKKENWIVVRQETKERKL